MNIIMNNITQEIQRVFRSSVPESRNKDQMYNFYYTTLVFLRMNYLIGKDSDAGRDWGQEEKGATEDEMAGWHHRLDGHEFE